MLKKHSLALLLLAPIGFLYGQDFKAYDQTIGNLPISIKMVAIPAGKFKMGSPDSDKNHQPDEGPQTNVEIGAFWMAATETTHDQFSAFRFEDKDADPLPDAISRPTAQYIDLTWGMGKEGGYPANSMQPFTAIAYCRWLYRKTGVFFRLPTEAEWEYACKANSDTQMPKGITTANLGEYAWYAPNAKNRYHKVAEKKPNEWGLYDILGNVTEWTLDMYDPAYYTKLVTKPQGDFFIKRKTYRSYHTARGGGFKSKIDELRPADRMPQTEEWNQRDPQIPKSRWWLTDGDYVGFRVIRPLKQPSKEEAEQFFKDLLGEKN